MLFIRRAWTPCNQWDSSQDDEGLHVGRAVLSEEAGDPVHLLPGAQHQPQERVGCTQECQSIKFTVYKRVLFEIYYQGEQLQWYCYVKGIILSTFVFQYCLFFQVKN